MNFALLKKWGVEVLGRPVRVTIEDIETGEVIESRAGNLSEFRYTRDIIDLEGNGPYRTCKPGDAHMALKLSQIDNCDFPQSR